MRDNNKLEIIRAGRSVEIDLLTPIEQGLIYGGENEVDCGQGYVKTFFSEKCDCNYKSKGEGSAPD